MSCGQVEPVKAVGLAGANGAGQGFLQFNKALRAAPEVRFLQQRQGLLRRKTWLRGGEAAGDEALEEFRFAGKHIDFREQVLRWDGTEQPLTLMEATLLRYLVRHDGQTVSRKALLEEVWGVREDTDTRTVDNFVARLRRYIEAEPSDPKHLHTIRGVGYRFVSEPAG